MDPQNTKENIQFENNITTILKLFDKQNIQVYIGNLVSNNKDLHPFASTQPQAIGKLNSKILTIRQINYFQTEIH